MVTICHCIKDSNVKYLTLVSQSNLVLGMHIAHSKHIRKLTIALLDFCIKCGNGKFLV